MGPQALPPSVRGGPISQVRRSLGPLSVIQIHPCASEVIQVAPQPKAAASSLERLRFRRCTRILVVGPLLASGRMRTKAKDGQVTSDKHLGRGCLVLASLEIG